MLIRTWLALVFIVICGCVSASRTQKDRQVLLDERRLHDAAIADESHHMVNRLVEALHREQDESTSHGTPPVFDFLVVSGGGDWGAFGAGVLRGWGKVSGPLARPQFDVVSGVSTGALIAPFAFLGDDPSIDRVDTLYRNPKKDWVRERGWLYFLPNNASFAEIPGLERELRDVIDLAFAARVAEVSRQGRVLVVNTTNVDDGVQRAWDLGAECARAVREGSADRVHLIMLASSGIPAAFPARIIDDQMYVDGGVTSNIIYGGRLKDAESLAGRWAQMYPDQTMPLVRYWVIINNQMRFPPQVTDPTWPKIISRSISMSIQAATMNSLRHLFAIAELAEYKYGARMEVRYMTVPDDWAPPNPNVFDHDVMNTLADLGYEMGQNPANWITESP